MLWEAFFYSTKVNYNYYLNQLRQALESNDPYLIRKALEEVLSIQRPTKERLPFYEKVWKEHNFEDIVDIGSGLNPVSVLYVNKPYNCYTAIDIDPNLLQFVKEIFNLFGKGITVEKGDFLTNNFEDLSGEVVLLWKVISLIYKIKFHSGVLEFLDSLKERFDYISISFPRKTLGKGKPIGRAWKGYMRKVAEKLRLKIVKEFEIPTEYFVLLRTH